MKIIETNLKFKSVSPIGAITHIVIHHAASARDLSATQIHNMHLNNGWSGIGYHFVVRQNGIIERGRPEDKLGAHCANANSNRLGICFAGNFDVNKMNETQLNAGKELIEFLKRKYPNAKLIRHKDVIKQSTACPGKYFPFDEVTKDSETKPTTIQKQLWEISITGEEVKSLQRVLNIKVDGYFGNDTLKACNTLRQSGAYSSVVFQMQTRLNKLGYSFKCDGYFGPTTLKNVKSFQSSRKLVDDGIVGNNTWKELYKK